MTPVVNNELLNNFTIAVQPSKTYALDVEKGVIRGYANGLGAVKQAVYKALNTERYDHLIYSWNYGSELKELFGKPISLVYPEVKRRIEEGLKQDDRINSVENFSFEKKKGSLHVTFTVVSTEGSFESEVNVNV
ncbi:MAG TPA: DUF2634 domain-containing protein [Lachnospiraceae bacterium]|nr:DUF2634 domain-containing protein [Lachnospiraceae bacterium]